MGAIACPTYEDSLGCKPKAVCTPRQELLTGISVLAIQFVRSNANGTKFCATMVLILGGARTLTCVFHEEKTMTETCALNNALHNALKMSFSALAHFCQTDAKEKQVVLQL